MITRNTQNEGYHCKGKGMNCYNCKDKNKCCDYIYNPKLESRTPPKCNLVKDEFISSVYINIDEYLRLTNALKKAKQDLDTIRDRLNYVSKSKAQNEVGKLLANGFVDGIENNKLEKLKEGK